MTTCLALFWVDTVGVVDAIADKPGKVQLVAWFIVIEPVVLAIEPRSATALAHDNPFHRYKNAKPAEEG